MVDTRLVPQNNSTGERQSPAWLAAHRMQYRQRDRGYGSVDRESGPDMSSSSSGEPNRYALASSSLSTA